ncbi:chorismate-binding protein [Ralstonia solanacearum]|uniref:chorismate-binding protein n=1 Tax=Ralstonia solanacearum TaxID=305 RepID=UPI0018D1CF90|nr:chorismate-binding protein [Ralstonia solanacearum]
MKKNEYGSYWEQACRFFRSTSFAKLEGSYFLHNRNSETVRIGVMCQLSVSVGGGHVTRIEDGQKADAPLPSDGGSFFKHIEKLMKKEAPCFLVVSPDIHRRYVDTSLPQVHLVQPALEFIFSPDEADGQISYARDAACERQGLAMLRAAIEKPLAARQDDPGVLRPFAELAAGWIPAEEDESFLKRLSKAIDNLQAYPDGKMTLTRAYERRMAAQHDPFKLYELHAGINGEYAFSHFFCIQEDVYSVGTTPENVFEIHQNALSVDVVAATCIASTDDRYLARELYDNPKQIKEHRSSLANRQDRFKRFCVDGSIRVVQDMHVKSLRNVCHLHSVFTGKLLPQVTLFDLVGNIFPLLGARPKELLAKADAETAPHRYYAGVVGHLHQGSGGCFLNIRNALLKNEVIHAKVGVGVIKESNPELELVETRDKLSGLLEAIYLWEQSGACESGPELQEGSFPKVAPDVHLADL